MPAQESQPRLAVVISIDQFRADFLPRFRPYFGEGGFKRLLENGADFQNNFYRHAVTKTAAGHATIATGVHADVHGIIGNDWIEMPAAKSVESVEDSNFPLVGAAPRPSSPGGLLEAKAGRSPLRLLTTTVGDQLKIRYGNQSKVFSVSNKDRSAVLLGGKLADGAYWMDGGRVVTSTYYRKELPAWITAFNEKKGVEAYFGKTWDRLIDKASYDLVQGPDDADGESTDAGMTRTLPKVINGGAKDIGKGFYIAYDNSPFSLELLGRFAEEAVSQEKLGQRGAPDLLCVSFSQIDTVGHSYGPDSHEMMDSVLRLDRVLASLFAKFDKEVGRDRWVVVITADHGSASMPERVHALRPEIPAGRFRTADMDKAVMAALDEAYGKLPEGEFWAVRDGGYRFRPQALALKKITAAEVAEVAKKVMQKADGIAQVYTRAELLAAEPEGDSFLAMSRRSYNAERGQDVVYVLKPYFVTSWPAGTNHGSPYDYDTHVPQLWYGFGVPKGVHPERVGVDDIAPTMSALLHIPAPPEAKGNRLF